MSEIYEFASLLRISFNKLVVSFFIAFVRAACLVDLILIMFNTG